MDDQPSKKSSDSLKRKGDPISGSQDSNSNSEDFDLEIAIEASLGCNKKVKLSEMKPFEQDISIDQLTGNKEISHDSTLSSPDQSPIKEEEPSEIKKSLIELQIDDASKDFEISSNADDDLNQGQEFIAPVNVELVDATKEEKEKVFSEECKLENFEYKTNSSDEDTD